MKKLVLLMFLCGCVVPGVKDALSVPEFRKNADSLDKSVVKIQGILKEKHKCPEPGEPGEKCLPPHLILKDPDSEDRLIINVQTWSGSLQGMLDYDGLKEGEEITVTAFYTSEFMDYVEDYKLYFTNTAIRNNIGYLYFIKLE